MHARIVSLLAAALAVSMLLAGCAPAANTPPATDTPSAAGTPSSAAAPNDAETEALALYRAFFQGDASAAAMAIGYGTPASSASFSAPDTYSTCAPAGVAGDWTIRRFVKMDLDGDGVSELILSLEQNGEEEYAILTSFNGALYSNELVYRAFLQPKADGTFAWSNGAMDNGYARAAFGQGVLVEDCIASRLDTADGTTCMLNGETATQAEYDAFSAEQDAKPELPWTAFDGDAIAAVLEKQAE